MRVRLHAPLSGVSAGIRLSQFLPDVIYEVDSRTGRELVSLGAESVPPTAPAVALPEQSLLDHEQLIGGVSVRPAGANGSGRTAVSGGVTTNGSSGSSSRHRRRG